MGGGLTARYRAMLTRLTRIAACIPARGDGATRGGPLAQRRTMAQGADLGAGLEFNNRREKGSRGG
eukprot:9512741-Alexandrium_andersonii.AAC.1